MTLTRNLAIGRAWAMFKRTGQPVFIVWEDEHYHLATEYDMQTYFNGAHIDCAVMDRGTGDGPDLVSGSDITL